MPISVIYKEEQKYNQGTLFVSCCRGQPFDPVDVGHPPTSDMKCCMIISVSQLNFVEDVGVTAVAHKVRPQ